MAKPVRIAETPPRYPLKVRSIDLIADEIYRVRLDPHPLPWVPGDCVTLHAPEADEGRPYSFSGSPNLECSEFWIRKFPQGKVSRFLTEQKVGSTIEVSPPFGWFRPCEPADSPKIFIATGTGVAPFLSACCSPNGTPDVLLWGMRNPIPVPQELNGIPLKIFLSQDRTSGVLRGRVTDHIPNLDLYQHPHFYLCGLDAMIEDVSNLLRKRGVPDQRIHSECFFTSSSSS